MNRRHYGNILTLCYLSVYEVKNNLSLFERPFKLKNGGFYFFVISSLEYLKTIKERQQSGYLHVFIYLFVYFFW